ncbi:MAG: sigma-54 dependent transcriptional regulator [Bacteroidota bacterium]
MSVPKSMNKPSVLLIDSNDKFRANFKFTFDDHLDLRHAPDMTFAEKFLKTFTFDLILLDLVLSEEEPLEVGLSRITELRKKYPQTAIIVITGTGKPSIVVKAIENGARNYFHKNTIGTDGYEKSWLEKMTEAAKEGTLNRKNDKLKAENKRLSSELQKINEVIFIGESPRIKEIKKELRTLGQKKPDTTVLITGETGVGKDVTARYLHQQSVRSKQAFVPVNLTQITPTLLESTLFGHKKGAFTGATEDRMGLFEQANHGILFLDEIGEISLELQTQLLRVLQDKVIRRVGDSKEIKLDIQIVTATNKNLPEAVANKTFRFDLYQRLKVYPIKLPPLRERREDIPALIAHFMKTEVEAVEDLFTPSAYQMLLNYYWPGNIRELQFAMDYIELRQGMQEKDFIDESCLPEEIREGKQLKPLLPQIELEANANEEPELTHKQKMALADLQPIEKALKESFLKKGIVAQKLNTNTDNLRYKVNKYYKLYPELFEYLPSIRKTYKLPTLP